MSGAMTVAAAHRVAVTRRMQRSNGWHGRVVSELWAFRELLYFFVWRDVKVRYKQTALGAGHCSNRSRGWLPA